MLYVQAQTPTLDLLWKWKWSRSVLSDSLGPMEGSLQGCAVDGIFQARILEQAAISFFRGSSQPRDQTQVSCIADRRFTFWHTREAPICYMLLQMNAWLEKRSTDYILIFFIKNHHQHVCLFLINNLPWISLFLLRSIYFYLN